MRSFFGVIAAGGLCVASGSARAEFVDFSGVTLSGSNPFTFQDSTLGEVTLTYSGGFRVEGVTNNWGGQTLLGLGSTSQVATLTFSFETAVTSLDVRLYDLDLSERVDFGIADGTALTLVSPNAFGPANSMNGLRVTGSGADLPNGSSSNFTAVRISGDAFIEFSLSFVRPGASSGAMAVGFGEFVPVPGPGAVSLLGVVGLAAVRRRR